MSHSWLKQWVNSSVNDPLIISAEAKFGIHGFFMVMKLREILAAQTPFRAMPTCKINEKALGKFLWCRQPKLTKFITFLKNSGEFEVSFEEQDIIFTSAKFAELLSDRSISSKLRKTSGSPDREIDKKELIDKKEITVSSQNTSRSSTNNFFKTVSVILIKKGPEVLEELPNHYKKYLEDSNSVNFEEFENLKTSIKRQFSSTEKSKLFGENIITKVTDVFDSKRTFLNQQLIKNKMLGSPEMIQKNWKNLFSKAVSKQSNKLTKKEWHDIHEEIVNFWASIYNPREITKYKVFFENYDKFYPLAEEELDAAPFNPNAALNTTNQRALAPQKDEGYNREEDHYEDE